MIDVQLRLRGEPSQRRTLAALPAVGAYITGPNNRLWQVDAVAFDSPAVQVYAVQVSDRLAGELQSVWAGWGEADSPEAPSRSSKGKTAPRSRRPKQCDVRGESSTIRPCPVCAAKAAKSKRGG